MFGLVGRHRISFVLATPLMLAVLAACDPAAASPSPGHTTHQTADPQLARVESVLTERFGMRFTDAGPHHRLGRADGTEVDLVGSPIEQVVVSVPYDETRDPSDTLVAYVVVIGEALEVDEALSAWVAETLGGWGRVAPLEAETRIDEWSVRMTSEENPPYVVLVMGREGG